jgi:hypothetical protein
MVCLLAGLASCKSTSQEVSEAHHKMFDKALQNAELANEGFIRCNDYMNAWLSFADPESKLVPRTLDRDKDIWNANDCAADNFPFLVLTSFFTDPDKYDGLMREMLANEIRLTSRIKSLPDTYSFSKKGFLHDSVSMPRVIFGTTEYIKDGLLPITEWLGTTPWSHRMLTMLEDMNEHVDVAGGFGENSFGAAPEDEVNGELLQILSRVYWMTGDENYLDWAVQIADYFVNDAFPLDSHYLRLRDHGCEIVSGLCELYVTLHYADSEKKAYFQKQVHRLLDYILKEGRNEDGLFYNAINPKTGEVAEPNLADTWGYTLNGFYSVYMVDKAERHREAVTTVFSNLHKYHNYNWENLGADGYADAIEGALNLYNRIPDERAAKWVDAEIRVMWSMQDSAHRANAQQWNNTGIIEGWYGDGNFARTTIMYNLWKSKGTYLQPWKQDVKIGAEMKGDTLFISVQSETPWEGRLYFDRARHAENMKLPVDWPRINQFPQWFTIDPEKQYDVIDVQDGSSRKASGKSMTDGIDLTLKANETKRLMVVNPD